MRKRQFKVTYIDIMGERCTGIILATSERDATYQLIQCYVRDILSVEEVK